MADGLIPLWEALLGVAGAVVASTLSSIGAWGYRATRSPTMLRIHVSFLLVAASYLMRGVSAAVGIDLRASAITPAMAAGALAVVGLAVLAAATEMFGFFFLAFSHLRQPKFMSLVGAAVSLSISPVAAAAVGALRALTLYFVSYSVLETLLAYASSPRRESLLAALGLAAIAGGEFLDWMQDLGSAIGGLGPASIALRAVGLVALLAPVASVCKVKGLTE